MGVQDNLNNVYIKFIYDITIKLNNKLYYTFMFHYNKIQKYISLNMYTNKPTLGRLLYLSGLEYKSTNNYSKGYYHIFISIYNEKEFFKCVRALCTTFNYKFKNIEYNQHDVHNFFDIKSPKNLIN